MGIDWKTAAISELRDLPLAEQALESLPELIGRQDAIIHRIRTSDPERPVGGGGEGDALLSAMVYREELRFRLVETKKTVAAIRGALATLGEEEQNVLDRLYIHAGRGNVDKLCEELGVEQSSVYRRRDKALRGFIRCLYGLDERVVGL